MTLMNSEKKNNFMPMPIHNNQALKMQPASGKLVLFAWGGGHSHFPCIMFVHGNKISFHNAGSCPIQSTK